MRKCGLSCEAPGWHACHWGGATGVGVKPFVRVWPRIGERWRWAAISARLAQPLAHAWTIFWWGARAIGFRMALLRLGPQTSLRRSGKTRGSLRPRSGVTVGSEMPSQIPLPPVRLRTLIDPEFCLPREGREPRSDRRRRQRRDRRALRLSWAPAGQGRAGVRAEQQSCVFAPQHHRQRPLRFGSPASGGVVGVERRAPGNIAETRRPRALRIERPSRLAPHIMATHEWDPRGLDLSAVHLRQPWSGDRWQAGADGAARG